MNLSRRIASIGAVFTTSLLSGCLSLSSYQTAEALPEGKSQFGVGLTVTTIKPDPASVDVIYEDISYFTPEIMYRAGVGGNFDMGAKLWFTYPAIGIVVDGKYQFVDGDKFDMAVDLGVGYSGVETGSADTRISFVDVVPALLMTYHFSDKASLTLTPKFLYRKPSGAVASDAEHYTGATLMLALGRKIRVMPEVGYFKGEDATGFDNEFTYYGIGFMFNIE